MDNDIITRSRKLSQQYAYTSIHMHEAIAQKAGLRGTDHKYLGFFFFFFFFFFYKKGPMTAGSFQT